MMTSLSHVTRMRRELRNGKLSLHRTNMSSTIIMIMAILIMDIILQRQQHMEGNEVAS